MKMFKNIMETVETSIKKNICYAIIWYFFKYKIPPKILFKYNIIDRVCLIHDIEKILEEIILKKTNIKKSVEEKIEVELFFEKYSDYTLILTALTLLPLLLGSIISTFSFKSFEYFGIILFSTLTIIFYIVITYNIKYLAKIFVLNFLNFIIYIKLLKRSILISLFLIILSFILFIKARSNVRFSSRKSNIVTVINMLEYLRANYEVLPHYLPYYLMRYKKYSDKEMFILNDILFSKSFTKKEYLEDNILKIVCMLSGISIIITKYTIKLSLNYLKSLHKLYLRVIGYNKIQYRRGILLGVVNALLVSFSIIFSPSLEVSLVYIYGMTFYSLFFAFEENIWKNFLLIILLNSSMVLMITFLKVFLQNFFNIM